MGFTTLYIIADFQPTEQNVNMKQRFADKAPTHPHHVKGGISPKEYHSKALLDKSTNSTLLNRDKSVKFMWVSISSKTFPTWTNPRDMTQRRQNPPSGQSLCTKILYPGQNRQSKAPPPGHKVRKFHKCIYKL